MSHVIFSGLRFGEWRGSPKWRVGLYKLLLFGLIIGGCIFNYLNEKNDNIYVSWIVHMFINFGINTVGGILFGIF